MKKLLTIFAFMGLMVLVSCGPTPTPTPKPTDFDVPEFDLTTPVTITYWHANGAALTTVLESIRDEFVEKYPNITVDLVSYGDYTTLRDTVTGAITAGNTPTAAQTYPDHVAVYLDGGALVSLDSYIKDERYGLSQEELNQFLPGFLGEGTIYDEDGTRYALPFNKSTEILYYNKDVFEANGWTVPETWDDVIEICKAWQATDHYKAAVEKWGGKVAGMSYDSEANLFITLTQQWGGTYTAFDENGQGIFSAFGVDADSTAKSKAALSWYLEQFNNKYIATTSYFGADYSSTAFLNGQCIMTVGSSAGAGYNDGMDTTKNTETLFETGVSAYPQKAGTYSETKGNVIQQGTNVSLFKCTDPQEQLAGWLWLKHMTSYESALAWATETAYFPIRYDVLNSDEYQDHIKGIVRAEDGSIVSENQTIAARAKEAGLKQQNWFYTNVAFFGSSKARDEAETLVQAILYGTDGQTLSIDAAYANALRRLTSN